jgi:hypothetical protein
MYPAIDRSGLLKVLRLPEHPMRNQALEYRRRISMQTSLVYAFLIIAAAPLIGIWRGHAWAKANGMVLRTVSNQRTNQAA